MAIKSPDEKNFRERCCDIIAEYHRADFDQYYVGCMPEEITSPIEQTLYLAIMVLSRINSIEQWGDDSILDKSQNKELFFGLDVKPQKTIGKYRVDFLVGYSRDFCFDNSEDIKKVIVECDSQMFHERTERERRYEKERDRFLQVNGYKVFRYTGKEIKDRPFHTAAEIMAYVMNRKKEDLIDENFIQED